MYLITKWFGTFFCDKKGIKKKILFPKDAKEISKRLIKIDKKQILTEEKKILKNNEVIVNEKRLERIGRYIPSDPFFKKFKAEPEDYGYSIDLLHNATFLLTKNKVQKKLASEDLQIIQMVNALDDLIQTSNLLSERLECWSVIPTSEEKVKPFKNVYITVKNEIRLLEEQIQSDMKTIAPNTSEIAGPLIGARLLSYARGLEKLAMLPSSTIQIMGAEKALFRFKKEGGKPPKHGVIFQNSIINKASRNNRGKIARILASNISIAAKADAFTKRDISGDLNKNMKKRIERVVN